MGAPTAPWSSTTKFAATEMELQMQATRKFAVQKKKCINTVVVITVLYFG